MAKNLYIDFLDDTQIYHLAEGFWKRFFDRYSKIIDSDYQQYLNKRFANGRKFYNGNPIFDAYFPKLNKAVRVIQEEPENKEIEIGAWIKNLES